MLPPVATHDAIYMAPILILLYTPPQLLSSRSFFKLEYCWDVRAFSKRGLVAFYMRGPRSYELYPIREAGRCLRMSIKACSTRGLHTVTVTIVNAHAEYMIGNMRSAFSERGKSGVETA